MLAGRSARYAVNAPLLTPETAQALAPYLPLARTLGRLYAQFAPDLSGLTLEVAGELASHDTSSLVAATLGGLLADTEERVNVVNAPAIAKARGIVTRGAQGPRRGTPRLAADPVRVGDVGRWHRRQRRAAPRPPPGALAGHGPVADHMLITHHQDRPGTVGKVGVLLGESDVNISAMYLARTDPRADAYMILALDDAVSLDTAASIRADGSRAGPVAHRSGVTAGDATLVLVRHGQTTWVAESRFQGSADPPLSTIGESQAAAVAARLARPQEFPALPLPHGAPRRILALTPGTCYLDGHGHLVGARTGCAADARARPGRACPG